MVLSESLFKNITPKSKELFRNSVIGLGNLKELLPLTSRHPPQENGRESRDLHSRDSCP